ncbi:MAG: hypothetical protein WAN36_03555 [Calditrichia bacterium]
MNKHLKNTLINSTIAFVSAFIITTLIHEAGHFISYRLFGIKAVLYHNYVETAELIIALKTRVISAMAGPFISLFQGLIFAGVIIFKKNRSPVFLLMLWLSLLGFINFFGYLMLTPLSTTGDTGKTAELLHISYYVRVLIGIFGLAAAISIVLKMGKYFSGFIPENDSENSKTGYVYCIMFFPIIIGSVLNVLLAFPVATLLSVVYPATSSFVVMSSFGAILKTPGASVPDSSVTHGTSRFLAVILLSAVILNRLLTMGFG